MFINKKQVLFSHQKKSTLNILDYVGNNGISPINENDSISFDEHKMEKGDAFQSTRHISQQPTYRTQPDINFEKILEHRGKIVLKDKEKNKYCLKCSDIECISGSSFS